MNLALALVLILVIGGLVLAVLGRAPFAREELPEISAETAVPGKLVAHRLRVDGIDRRYLLYLPETYDRSRAYPLVIVLHGGGGMSKGISQTSRMHDLADREGFIVVYPDGTGRESNKKLTWNAGGQPPQGWAERQGVDDVAFMRALVEAISTPFRVDRKRIYVAGMSKGGMLAYHLACRMSDVVAAVAVVAGTMTSADCQPQHPVAVLHIHGSADENVPLAGGKGPRTAANANWPPVAKGIEFWRQNNDALAKAEVTYAEGAVTCQRFRSQDNHADVELCIVDGGGHAWPGSKPKIRHRVSGEYVDQTFPASLRIWQFFQEHPKA
jgi:polyhydroxybutyrate depolymerase